MSTQGRLTICQISDIHCGSPYFIPDLLERSILEINDLDPTAVVVSGDLTNAGYRQEYEQAAEYIRRFRCEHLMVIPGNHDSRNVGYVHFERLFGERYSVIDFEDAIMVGVDSSEPDLNDGRVGREHYGFIHESFAGAEEKLKIFVVHHHLIPIPGTGRERNIVFDAGDVLELLADTEVDLVLSGHKHVPYSWRLENMFIVNAGTASTTRLRGNTRPCYNIIEVENERVRVFRKYPFRERELVVDFNAETHEYYHYEEIQGDGRPGNRRQRRLIT
ncbi:metallophosphoesterase [Rubrobacter xylanophilus DSM 9941]|uniref:Metallophosphoesterase n=1 Tax=Rubrobacter xylanophilus (strain DSM 9941 / JCM 11954 / NBRC 16129 / PRD-1) TaxID=266117 RepID=Q1AVF9_RUBXD|nr:metallophosphoesterase family protein [Rubrobacter xylanophilus]ABG04619.1 metallophosphoesterase [Rubrobacter xylanophilus DSM 9941]